MNEGSPQLDIGEGRRPFSGHGGAGGCSDPAGANTCGAQIVCCFWASCFMFGISRYREPSELWCMVDSVTAAIASMIGSAVSSRARNIQARVPKIAAVARA